MGQPRHGGRCSSRGDGKGAVTAFAVGDLGEFCSLLILNFIPFSIKKKKKKIWEKKTVLLHVTISDFLCRYL